MEGGKLIIDVEAVAAAAMYYLLVENTLQNPSFMLYMYQIYGPCYESYVMDFCLSLKCRPNLSP
jgi:hypothetical protein